MISYYTARKGQSLYDVTLQVYGTLDLLKNGVSAVQQIIADNSLANINADSLQQISITYNTDLIADNAMFNQNADNAIYYATDVEKEKSFDQSFDISFR